MAAEWSESVEPGRGDGGVPDYDVVVVGAGMGGIYAVHRFRELGLSVRGFEGAAGVGGVWYHNRYPGARVDVESVYYCFYDPELYRQWEWTERYASQPELLGYLNFVADRYQVKPHFRFNTWVIGAVWSPETNTYTVRTDHGDSVTARFVVMTTGQLSKARAPMFEGLDEFTGEWVQTSHWPERDVDLRGKRVGVIGTGSSGVQTVTAIAPEVEQLYVFQRTAHYSVPAHNGPLDRDQYADLAADPGGTWRAVLNHPAGALMPLSAGAAAEFTPAERQELLEQRWANGGHTMNTVFSDQGTNIDTNTIVADFVRSKVRQVVQDPATADKLIPRDYPIGSKRLIVDTGYYETFNRDNVTLVDIKIDPIARITPTGIQTRNAHYDLDVIIVALGFEAFTGALDGAGIRNEHGNSPSDNWTRGPRTYLGLTTTGFPNLFLVTGPGSPSVLANMLVGNVQHIDLIGQLITYMDQHGYQRVEPTTEAEQAWTQHTADVASKLIRRNVDNYMVHINHDDGTRIFIPYPGGLATYVQHCQQVVDNNFDGFTFK